MPSHDTSLAEASQTLTGEYSASPARTRNVLLQACGLASEANVNELNANPIHGRGRPQQVCWTHLWSSLLLCALQGMNSFADWRRFLGLQQLGRFPLVWLTRNGLVKRLLQAGLAPLQELWEMLNTQLAQTGPWAKSASLALFANDIFALDETLLDAIGRYLKPLRGLNTHDPACFAGKLVGLFDLRRQRWSRLEWRKDVHENCRVDMLDFLQGLSAGSLLLFDLGYFSFPFFDTSSEKYVWKRFSGNLSNLL